MKRRRLEFRAHTATLLSRDCVLDADLQQPLVTVVALSRYGPEAPRLPHVVSSLTSFLDYTLARACAADSLSLAPRLIAEDEMEPFDSGKRDPRFASGGLPSA